MNVRWTPEAEQDRHAIWDFIAAENPQAAARLDSLFAAAAKSLQSLPERGRPGLIAATRELFPHDSYRLVYEIDAETVWILAIVHAARSWPPLQS